jgi:hypothetical protein
LLYQPGQVLAEEEAALVVADTSAEAAVSGASLVAALAPRQLSMAEGFEEHQRSGVHTLPAEV